MARGIQNHPLAPQTVPQRASKSAFQGRNLRKKSAALRAPYYSTHGPGDSESPRSSPNHAQTAPEKRFSPQQWLGSWMMASDAMEAPSTWEPPRKWWKWLIVAMTSPPQKCSYQVNIHRGWIEKLFTWVPRIGEVSYSRIPGSGSNDIPSYMCEQSSASDSTIFTPESSSGQIQPKQDESSAERETKDFPFKGDSILSSMTSLIWTYHHPNPRLYYASITHNFKQTSFINILEYNYACQLRPTRFHCLSGEIHNEHVMLEIVKDERGFLLYQIISNPEFVLAETTMLVCQGATSGTWEVANLHEICGGFMYMCCLNPDKRQVTLIHILRQYYQVEESGGMSLVQAICGGAHKGK
ncbi:hypothetical protein DFH09DRAFT_1067434 [Mycena vulgaris]|nr:hypothetical protein DFH09DRAFT_1067434 [Mycena vulgaris]